MIKATEKDLVFGFFQSRLGLHDSLDFRGVLHVPDHCHGTVASMNDVAVAVAYNGFVGRTCCMHSVIQKPEFVTRGMVRETFAFPFNVCGVEAVLALVDSTNDAALRFDKHLGFTEIARIPNGGTTGDLIVLQMLRADCRWLPKTH